MLYKYKNKKHTFVKCVCDCGSEKIVDTSHLNRNNISCGCMSSYYRSINNRTNEIGKKYDMLTITDIDYSKSPSVAKCVCDCGNEVSVSKSDVVNGHTKSCGCLRAKRVSESNSKDFTGYVSDAGVKIIKKSYKTHAWHWTCLCPLCGKEFVALPAKIISNHTTSCGCKIQSSKERIIENHLNKLNIKYEKEYRFSDCKYKYTLPFDFAVFNKSNEIDFLIEYDGKQHTQPIDFYGGQKQYEKTIIRDNIKNEYCYKNNIRLIRFNYLDTDEKILNTITKTIYP